MKATTLTLLILVWVFTISSSFKQQTVNTGNLQVTVTAIKNSNGEIVVALFNKPECFPNKINEAYKSIRGKIIRGTCTITFENIPFGNYAVGIYHDENNNTKLDETWYGMPIEGIGVSNNPKVGVFSPPNFETAKFKFENVNSEISIKMKYL